MPSPPTEAGRAQRWSLTSRLGWRFAFMTSALIAIYALGSMYLLYDALRDDLHIFLQHESAEVIAELDEAGDDLPAMNAVLQDLADVAHNPGCAYRLRDESGHVLAEAGRPRLLALDPDPIPVRNRAVGLSLLRRAVFGHAVALPERHMVFELIVDADELHEALFSYLRSALLVFLISVPLAAICGRITARRGLVGLRDLVAQARVIDVSTSTGARLRPQDAPEELRELAAEVNAVLARTEEGLRAMRTFTASLAHELRSPLQNLIGETEVALLAARPPEEYVTLLRSNLDDLHELSDAVDNLVAFCRSNEPQPHPAQRERFDLLAEADLRLQRERRSARRNGLQLNLSGEGDAHLSADREGVLRVLRNLVGNALVWSPRGGSVDVRVSGEDGVVRLVVDDLGPGIPEELRYRVFEPFVSGRPRRGERGGYGLGLTICRSVVSEHGGRLWHEAREGGGTRFIAEFPRGA
jgi:two-component system heavy metal sensor histidine kinase CusS